MNKTIENLKKLKSFHNGSYGADINKAIKALEQEPCEDMVSRQTVNYIIKSHIQEIITESGTDKNAHTNAVLRAIVNLVETIPSVTPTRKKGKWIPIPFVLDYESDAKCSLCQERFIAAIDYNYCPNCGAKMAESEVEYEDN